jgi:aminotransferase
VNYEKLMCQRVVATPPSGIRKFFDIVATMKDAISLGVGEPDFVTPWNMREAAIYSMEQGQTHYTSNWGTIELRRAIARYLREQYGITYAPENEICVTIGASEGIDLALRAICEPGDEVLVPDPSYVSYQPGIIFAGGTPVPVRTRVEDQFKLTAEAVKNAITPRTKALILPYPNNPTGAILTRAELSAIADVLRGTDIFVISDEIYSELTYGGAHHVSFASIPDMWERTITLNGFSKAFAMTGWRIGYACAPAPLLKVMVKIHQFTIMCAPTAAQAAALEGLRDGFENNFSKVREMTREYDRRRRMMVSGFRNMGLECFEPLGAFYVFPSISSLGMTSDEFCTKLLEQKQVACVPGTAFGAAGEGYIRCSYATSMEKLKEAIKRIAEFVEERRSC